MKPLVWRDLPATLFRLDPEGQVLFFPWGAYGAGYCIPDFARQRELYNLVRFSVDGFLPLLVLVAVVGLMGSCVPGHWFFVFALLVWLPFRYIRQFRRVQRENIPSPRLFSDPELAPVAAHERLEKNVQPGTWPNPFLTLAHLQLTFSPAVYPTLLKAARKFNNPFGSWPEQVQTDPHIRAYWTGLPRYLIARCPFCAEPYTELLDVHSLTKWVFNPNRQRAVLALGYIPENFIGRPGVGCAHLFAVQTFLNPNGTPPKELSDWQWSLREDVPYILPEYLPEQSRNQAVMHSIVVCRLEEQQFKPRFIVYTIAYYAPAGYEFREQLLAQPHYVNRDRGEDQMTSLFAAQGRLTYDLAYWVRRERLHWLDPVDLTLRPGGVAEFPYSHIQGEQNPAIAPLYED